MLVNLEQVLKGTENGYAVPAFNVYNMETVMGVIKAAEELKSPVIIQFYSRLATTGFADYLCPIMVKAAHSASVPVCVPLPCVPFPQLANRLAARAMLMMDNTIFFMFFTLLYLIRS